MLPAANREGRLDAIGGPQPRPLEGPRARARMLPFAVALAAGFAALPLPARDRHTVSVLGAAVLAALVAVAALTAPWSRVPSGAQAPPPLALLGVIALLDHGTGGRFASTGPLVAVPIMWLA